MTKARATAVLSLAAAGFVLAGCGGGPSEHAQDFAQAKEQSKEQSKKEVTRETLLDAGKECDKQSNRQGGTGVYVDKEGSVVTIDIAAYECLADKLNAPRSLRTRIGNTTGMMGGQEDTVGDYLWLWAYNKNNPLPFHLTITMADEDQ